MPQRSATIEPPGLRPPVVPRRADHRRLRTIAIAATSVTFVLIAIGGVVRATGSGLGCPGWPKCFDRWVPPLEFHALIEYSLRLVASVVIVLIALLAFVAWRRYRHAPRVFRSAFVAVGVVLVQAGLGGIVVKGALAPVLVTAHFATAMLLAGVLVYCTVAAFSVDAVLRPVDRFTVLARFVAAAAFGLLLVGAYVRGAGAGLAFRDWPLMAGEFFPELSSGGEALQFGHRLSALVVGVLVVALAARAWRSRRGAPVAVLAALAAALFAAQVLIGAANVWTELAAPAVVSHVAVAGLIWGSLVAVAAASRVGSKGGSA